MPIILVPLAMLWTRKKEKSSEAKAQDAVTVQKGLFSRAFARLVEAEMEKAHRSVAEYRRRIGLDPRK